MSAPLSGKGLLVVEENADLAELCAGEAARLGAAVTVCTSGRAALETLRLRRPDAAIVALPLADVAASEVVAALRRAGAAVVALSGVYRGPRAAEQIRRLGAADFFEKPFEIDAVMAALTRAAGAPSAATPAAAPVGTTPAAEDAIRAAALPALDDAPTPGDGAPEGLAAALPDAPRVRPLPAAAVRREGDLSTTSVPRLLVALHVGRATGALTVARGPVRKLLVVERGIPIYAQSSLESERFGPLCVARGLVTQDALEALRDERPQVRTGEALVASSLVSPEERAEVVFGQIRTIAWSTFEWRDGTYAFQQARPPEARIAVPLAMGDVLLDGMRRASTLRRLRSELPGGVHLAPSPDPAFELFELRLRAPEARLLTLADGTKSADDLVRLAELPERGALAFLQACRVMRLLDDVERVLASTRRIGFM